MHKLANVHVQVCIIFQIIAVPMLGHCLHSIISLKLELTVIIHVVVTKKK